jgi:hypothetical protein
MILNLQMDNYQGNNKMYGKKCSGNKIYTENFLKTFAINISRSTNIQPSDEQLFLDQGQFKNFKTLLGQQHK